jgi:hypothetical protein
VVAERQPAHGGESAFRARTAPGLPGIPAGGAPAPRPRSSLSEESGRTSEPTQQVTTRVHQGMISEHPRIVMRTPPSARAAASSPSRSQPYPTLGAAGQR